MSSAPVSRPRLLTSAAAVLASGVLLAGCSPASTISENLVGADSTTTRTSTVAETAGPGADAGEDSTGTGSADADSTSTNGSSSSTSSSNNRAAEPTRSPGSDSDSRASTSDNAAEERVWNELKSYFSRLKVGDQIRLDGINLEICTYGNGPGMTISGIDVDKGTTSCEFATVVAQTLAAGASPDLPVHDTLPRTVSATSPVTGDSYDMRCTTDETKIIRCTGGNNAEVIIR
ncbi:hypothetical protein [Corynebacterium sp. MNWGS58]|uniref:hypothetical protein n=1 Tax=Corynebacterium sp. 102791.4 TaxID=3104612 RepID=UPI003518E604